MNSHIHKEDFLMCFDLTSKVAEIMSLLPICLFPPIFFPFLIPLSHFMCGFVLFSLGHMHNNIFFLCITSGPTHVSLVHTCVWNTSHVSFFQASHDACSSLWTLVCTTIPHGTFQTSHDVCSSSWTLVHTTIPHGICFATLINSISPLCALSS